MCEIKEYTVYCPCCGYLVLKLADVGEICPICFWEWDFEVEDRVSLPSICNHGLTLNEARDNFEKFGAVEERLINFVVPYQSRILYKHINDDENE